MRSLKSIVQRVMFSLGYSVKRLTEEEKRFLRSSYDDSCQVDGDSLLELQSDNPRLLELQKRYESLEVPQIQHSLWSRENVGGDLQLPWFRGDNVYVWQFRQLKSELRLKQYLIYDYVRRTDSLDLLSKLKEDGAFGCWTFSYADGACVSRDLLESVNELNFIERHLGVSRVEGLRVLDVGAGYGRLAHRAVESFANLSQYDCIDAVPESTFLCDFYLRFRGVDHKARSVPLDHFQNLEEGSYHLAMNIHSFSECTRETIRWWLDRLVELKVPYLLIVPNDPDVMLSSEIDGQKLDFSCDIERAGFALKVKERVYSDKAVADLVGVDDSFFLYEYVGES